MTNDNAEGSNLIPSVEIKSNLVTVSTVKKINKTRENHGAKTIAVVTPVGFTEKARAMLEQQGAVCVTVSTEEIEKLRATTQSGEI